MAAHSAISVVQAPPWFVLVAAELSAAVDEAAYSLADAVEDARRRPLDDDDDSSGSWAAADDELSPEEPITTGVKSAVEEKMRSAALPDEDETASSNVAVLLLMSCAAQDGAQVMPQISATPTKASLHILATLCDFIVAEGSETETDRQDNNEGGLLVEEEVSSPLSCVCTVVVGLY